MAVFKTGKKRVDILIDDVVKILSPLNIPQYNKDNDTEYKKWITDNINHPKIDGLLGYINERGWSKLKRDTKRAINFYIRGAIQNDSWCLYRLVKIYMEHPKYKNTRQALYWYKKQSNNILNNDIDISLDAIETEMFISDYMDDIADDYLNINKQLRYAARFMINTLLTKYLPNKLINIVSSYM
jgi:hypothetical protein